MHERIRREWEPKIAAGKVMCAHPRCGRPIFPTEAWDLGHAQKPGAHERGEYAGPMHRACNRATRGPRQTTEPDHPQPVDHPF